MIDLDNIMKKLEAAGIVTKHATGISGDFSVEKHSHLLTSSELATWLHVLHEASGHDTEGCTDLHRWNMEFVDVN